MKLSFSATRGVAAAAALALLAACSADVSLDGEDEATFVIDYERYQLDNGLEVVLHQDASDPIVAVATIVHVGSSREQPGKTGFAHFFEHMSFNDSENVPRGANRQMIAELGGTRNGGTWSDGTVYYEVVPKDAFEKIMWIDSDRLGFMINTVTEAALEREKQVVKNEKRQRVDNAPYGHADGVIRANLYPEDHPYNWTVIGSLEDLQGATLEDVREFYDRYYGPNNATLVIAGDIDIERTRELVEYWFGEIKQGPEVLAPSPRPAGLVESKSLFYEDNFAKLPELRIVIPTVEQYNEDAYALDLLGELLAGSKESPLYKVIVEEKKLAPSVSVFHSTNELAGELVMRVRANAGVDLDEVKAAVEEGLARFESEGVPADELERIKAQNERQLYEGVEGLLNKAFQLAIYNEFAGDPGYVSVEAERTQAVTAADVMAVYDHFIKDRPYVMTSFVPKGAGELVVSGAVPADVVEEQIVAGAEAEVSAGEVADFEITETVNDRSEPGLGEAPLLTMPDVWTADLDNGMGVYGIESNEVPLVAFDLSIEGGHLLDPEGKAGLASLLADLMAQGTVNRTPAELEKAIGLLGASIQVGAGREEIRISGTTLARRFDETMALVEEILLEPRWDEAEYERLVRELETTLKGREGNPNAISSSVFDRLLYGEEHAFGTPLLGTPETVGNLSLEALKAFHAANLSPSLANFHAAGDVSQERVMAALDGIGSRWESMEVSIAPQPAPAEAMGRRVFFIDVPGAKQSVLRVGKLALSATDPDHNNLRYANQELGGGSSGRLFQLLRIEKGYTYGAYSGIGATKEIAPFNVVSSVRANVTRESLELIRDQIENYAATFGEEDMAVTKNQIVKANTRAFESLGAKLGLLRRMSRLGLPNDFMERDQEELQAMTLGDFHALMEGYLDEASMTYLIVGDAETQLGPVRALGFGEPTVLEIYGEPAG
jgi:zinc protease